MIAIGIDTSDRLCTAVISNYDKIIGQISLQTKDSHLKDLIPIIDYLLNKVNINKSDIDLFIIVQGPGSWSGIRIGVTSVKCLAQSLNKKVVGINSLDAFACKFKYTDNLVYPIIDASKNQVYFSVYNCKSDTPERISHYGKKKINDFLAEVNEKQKPSILIGSAIPKYYDKIYSFNCENLIIGSSLLNQLYGNLIIEAGLRKYRKHGPANTYEIAPIYLQRSDAEENYNAKYKTIKPIETYKK